ncbi:MAG: response regulator transcription factor [Gemmatimonadales bacterium]
MANILLVDDEAGVRNSLAAYLTKCGHDVRLASNGIEAMEALKRAPVDVVVTDINMPDMDGIETVMALRDAATGVGVIAMSGGGLFDKSLLLDSAGALGADVTLEKPIDLDELRTAIDALLGRKSPRVDE